MDISSTKAIERIARVLAAQHLSSNADGSERHAGDDVDASWQEHRGTAIAVLKCLREPDADMERAGDIAIWEHMIAAALGEHGEAHDLPAEPPEPGTDPLHEGP